MTGTNFNSGMAIVTGAVIIAAGIYLGSSHAADEPAAEAVVRQVAVIDMARVFDNCKKFQGRKAELQVEVKIAEEMLRGESDALKSMQAEAESALRGSEARERLEQEVAQRASDLQLKLARQKKELLKREALMYADAYDEVLAGIKQYAKQHGIYLVVRTNQKAIDRTDPQSVVDGLSRAVVYQDAADITDALIKQINTPAKDL